MKIKTIFNYFTSLFYPKLCVVCKEPLREGEEHCCLHCLLQFPRTQYHLSVQNIASDRFLGKVPYEKVSSYLYYNKGGITQKLVGEIKYKGNQTFGEWIGSYLAQDLLTSGFLKDIDCLVAVPLHAKKQKQRGFNQSEVIARGIASITGIPLEKECLFRAIANPTQTKKGIYERWLNTLAIFELKNVQTFAGKHVLIIDDVLTTGSTLEACAHRIQTSPGAKTSILTLAITQ